MINIVYLTINTVNNKIYVGVHSTDNDEIFDGYIGNGVFVSKVPKSPKTPFQFAVKKYGVKAFERITLFRCNTMEEALEIEAIIVDGNFLKRKDVYNAIVGGGLPPMLNKNIYQYSLDGTFISEYSSVEKASKQMGAAFAGVISNAASYKTVSFGYLWSYEKFEKLDLKDYKNSVQKVEVNVYDENGCYLESYNTLTEAGIAFSVKYSTISDAMKSGRKYKNLYFSSIKTDILQIKKQFDSKSEIHQYDLEGNYIKSFKNRTDLKSKLSIKTEGLSTAIYKIIPFEGYLWSLDKVQKLEIINAVKNTSLGKKIGQYTQSGELVKVYNTVRECRKDFGNVSKVLRGLVNNCKGFVFKYIE